MSLAESDTSRALRKINSSTTSKILPSRRRGVASRMPTRQSVSCMNPTGRSRAIWRMEHFSGVIDVIRCRPRTPPYTWNGGATANPSPYGCRLLDFGQSSCQRDAMDEEIQSLLRKLHNLCFGSRGHQISCPPEMPTHQGQTVRERRFLLVVPGGHWHRNATILIQLQGQHRHEREQRQQDGSGARNGLVRPLPLGLQPEMRPPFFKGDLD